MEETLNQGDDSPPSQQLSDSKISKPVAWTLLSVILIGALCLQVYGIGKMEGTPDECRLVENAVLLVEGYHPFNPDGYGMSAIRLWSAAFNGGWLAGNFRIIWEGLKNRRFGSILEALDESRQRFFADPLKVNMRLRWINALAAVVVVWLTYLIAARWSGYREAGLVAATVCAVSPTVVMWGTDFHPDQFQAVATLACIYFCIGEAGHAGRRGKKQWVAASVFCGIGMATKFIAITFWVPLVLAIVLGTRGSPARLTINRIIIATVLVLVAYLIINPYPLTDMSLFLKGIFKRVFFIYEGHGFSTYKGSGWMELIRIMLKGIGIAALSLATVGLVWGIKCRTEGSLVILFGIFAYSALLASSNFIGFRYVFSLVPLVSILASGAVMALANKVPGRLSALVALLLVIIASMPVADSLHIVSRRANGDTRTLAREWIERNIRPGSRIFTNYHAPILNYDLNSARYWRDYFGNRLTSTAPKGFPFEFFREAILQEERYYYKRFRYLAGMDKLPSPGYDLVELVYAPNNPNLTDGFDLFWVVVSRSFFYKPQKRALAGKLLFMTGRHGRLAARFPNKGLFGSEILIYKVEPKTPVK